MATIQFGEKGISRPAKVNFFGDEDIYTLMVLSDHEKGNPIWLSLTIEEARGIAESLTKWMRTVQPSTQS